ncbi:hypothetical protein JHK86_027561 [Glycine max]|nr:hypothetical protein JHK86_027561 [Glycine max]
MFGHAGDYSAVRASDNIEETTVIGSTTTSVKGVAEEPTRQRQTWCAYACFVRKVNGFRDLNALRDDLMELKPTLFAGVPRVFEKAYEGKALNKKNKNLFLSKVTFDGLVTCTMFIQTRFHAKDELVGRDNLLCAAQQHHKLIRDRLFRLFSTDSLFSFVQLFDSLLLQATCTWTCGSVVVIQDETLKLACKAMCKMLISIESGHELVTMHNEVGRLCEAMLAYIIREVTLDQIL